MPAHYVLDIENRIVLTIFKGVVTRREAAEETPDSTMTRHSTQVFLN
jgi:hypothetical protein